MSVTHYDLNANFVANDVAGWYAKATVDDMAVIALPMHPSVQLRCRPNGQVYWCTEGSKGLTVPLTDATQRLAMFQTRWSLPL